METEYVWAWPGVWCPCPRLGQRTEACAQSLRSGWPRAWTQAHLCLPNITVHGITIILFVVIQGVPGNGEQITIGMIEIFWSWAKQLKTFLIQSTILWMFPHSINSKKPLSQWNIKFNSFSSQRLERLTSQKTFYKSVQAQKFSNACNF